MRWIPVQTLAAMLLAVACSGSQPPRPTPTMTPLEMLAAADVGPIDRYWLGDTFDDLRLHNVAIRSDSGARLLELEYRGSSDACATIELAARTDSEPDAPPTPPRSSDASHQYRMPVLDGQAIIYESPVQTIPLRLEQGGQGIRHDLPTAVTRAGSMWTAAVVFPRGVARISTFCTFPAANPYNSLTGVRKIVEALRPVAP